MTLHKVTVVVMILSSLGVGAVISRHNRAGVQMTGLFSFRHAKWSLQLSSKLVFDAAFVSGKGTVLGHFCRVNN